MAGEVKETKKVIAAEGAETKEAMEAKQAEPNPLVEAVRKVLLAGIGAVALGKDEIEDFVGKLVERGEIAEADGRKLVKDVIERRMGQAKDQAKKAGDVLDSRVEEVLSRMNIPTKDEIESLSAKITALAQKVDELKKTL
jgi:poly(hydroxyalkanoate) granule-associated protein